MGRLSIQMKMKNVTALLEEKPYWVVVADESKAIVYSQDTRRSPLQELFSIENDSERQKIDSLISDRGGRSVDRQGHTRHTMTNEKVDPKKHLAEVFAKNIAGRIAKAKHSGKCRDFALIAAPRFLGILRGALAVTGNTVPFLTIDKEVVGRDTAFIEKLLAGDLAESSAAR